MIVDIPMEIQEKVDNYIHNILTTAVDIANNLELKEATPCTVLDTMAHKVKWDTHIARSNILAENKNDAEDTAEEIKITLWWILNTRLLLVQLPNHRYMARSGEINMILKMKTLSWKTLEIILG